MMHARALLNQTSWRPPSPQRPSKHRSTHRRSRCKTPRR